MNRRAVVLAVLAVGVASAPAAARDASLPACDMSRIALAAGPKWSEATEQHTVTVVLRNRSGRTCWIDGYPRVSLFDAHGREIPFAYSHRGDQMVTGRAPRRVVLRPGGRAYFVLNKNACGVAPSAFAARVRVSLPGSAAWRTLAIPYLRFPLLDYCGRSFATVAVSPIVRRLGEAAAGP